jgi:acyl-CoA synthetase (AMP-forming)/AMP-acid ligase II
MFGSPALLNRVGRYGEANGITLPDMKLVISAGAPVPASTLARYSKLLPDDAEIFTPYGATEALPVCSIGSREILAETSSSTGQGLGICVGRPVKGLSLAVIGISDNPVEAWNDELRVGQGEIGEITVRAPQATASYFSRPDATRQAKIPDPTGGFWHRMGDLGYLDEHGRVWFCGRKSHRVMTPEGTLYTIPVEGVFNTHSDVFRTALVGTGEPGKQRPVLCVELEKGIGRERLDAIRRGLLEIGARYPHTSGIRDILFHPSFPVDIRHNAKIFREKLSIWAERKLK